MTEITNITDVTVNENGQVIFRDRVVPVSINPPDQNSLIEAVNNFPKSEYYKFGPLVEFEVSHTNPTTNIETRNKLIGYFIPIHRRFGGTVDMSLFMFLENFLQSKGISYDDYDFGDFDNVNYEEIIRATKDGLFSENMRTAASISTEVFKQAFYEASSIGVFSDVLSIEGENVVLRLPGTGFDLSKMDVNQNTFLFNELFEACNFYEKKYILMDLASHPEIVSWPPHEEFTRNIELVSEYPNYKVPDDLVGFEARYMGNSPIPEEYKGEYVSKLMCLSHFYLSNDERSVIVVNKFKPQQAIKLKEHLSLDSKIYAKVVAWTFQRLNERQRAQFLRVTYTVKIEEKYEQVKESIQKLKTLNVNTSKYSELLKQENEIDEVLKRLDSLQEELQRIHERQNNLKSQGVGTESDSYGLLEMQKDQLRREKITLEDKLYNLEKVYGKIERIKGNLEMYRNPDILKKIIEDNVKSMKSMIDLLEKYGFDTPVSSTDLLEFMKI